MVGKLKKWYTTCIQITFPDFVVRLLKNMIQLKLFLDSRLRRNFNLRQRYLANQIRYGGDFRGIRNMLKSSCSHKNFIIFGRVDFNWHWDKDRLLREIDSERTRCNNPNIYLLTQSLIFLTMELADMPTKFQHSLQRFNSHINIITNQLNILMSTPH